MLIRERCQIVHILRLIPWICSVNFKILKEALTRASNQAGPSVNSSPKNADELGSCEDWAADMDRDQEECSSSSNLESPAEPPVS